MISKAFQAKDNIYVKGINSKKFDKIIMNLSKFNKLKKSNPKFKQ